MLLNFYIFRLFLFLFCSELNETVETKRTYNLLNLLKPLKIFSKAFDLIFWLHLPITPFLWNINTWRFFFFFAYFNHSPIVRMFLYSLLWMNHFTQVFNLMMLLDLTLHCYRTGIDKETKITQWLWLWLFLFIRYNARVNQ